MVAFLDGKVNELIDAAGDNGFMLVGCLKGLERRFPGKRRPGDLASILEAKDRTKAGQTAPPHGLCLEKVWYEARWGIGEPSPFGERS